MGEITNSKKPAPREQLFVGTFIALSWQMLAVVLVPAIGGHYLDQKFGSKPIFTIIGFALAISMAALVTYRAYRTLENDYDKNVANKDPK